MSARSAFRPGSDDRSAPGELGHHLHQLAQGLAAQHVAVQLVERIALGLLGHARQRADRAADADHVGAEAAEPVDAVEAGVHVAAQRLQVAPGGPRRRQERLGHAHRSQRTRHRARHPAAVDLGGLDAPAAEVEDPAVGERRAVHGAEVAEARLLALGEHAHRQAALGGQGAHHLVSVGGVARGAGGDHVDLVDVLRGAERRVQVGHVSRALDRIGPDAAGVRTPGEPHRVADLVHQAIGAARAVAEDDQAEGVRPHVDHREAAFRGVPGERYARRHERNPPAAAVAT